MNASHWVPLKQWLYERAARECVTYNTIWCRLRRAKKYRLQERRLNQRVILVREVNL